MSTERDELNTMLDDYAAEGDFDRDWQTALERADRAEHGFVRRGAPAVAAAAVVLWVAWTALPAIQTATGLGLPAPPEPAPTEAPVTPEDPGPSIPEGAMVIGYGQIGLLDLPAKPNALDVVLPRVARVWNTLGSELAVEGSQPGRTDVIVTYEDRPPEVRTIVVLDAPSSPASSKLLRIPYGAYGLVSVDREPKAISIGNPRVLGYQSTAKPTRFVLQGQQPGWTDVLVDYGDRREIFTVEVPDRPDEGLVDPQSLGVPGPSGIHPSPVAPVVLELAYGQAMRLEIGTPAKTVSVALPRLLEVSAPSPGTVMLSAKQPGSTDMLVVTEDGGERHYRVRITDR